MTHKKIAGIATVLILLFGVAANGAGVLNTPSTGYLLCINSKTKVVTHPGTATCPKGTKGLVVGSKGQVGAPGLTGATGLNGQDGSDGQDGKTLWNGTIDPENTWGAPGDMFINSATNTLFGPKNLDGTWPIGVSMIGPKGDQGPIGLPGINGANGSNGTTGPQGATGLTGATGATGATGTNGNSGVVAVTAPITNSGTSTSANLGFDYSALLNSLGMSTTVVDTQPRFTVNYTVLLTSGTEYLSFFTPLVDMTVSQVSMLTGQTGASGLTLARMGLFTWIESTSTLTLVARNASDTTLFNSQYKIFTRAFDTSGGFPSSYNLVAGTRYALGVIQVGTTPSYMSFSNYQTSLANPLPRLAGGKAGQTDLASNTGSISLSPPVLAVYGRFS
jgi:hypothetical protein